MTLILENARAPVGLSEDQLPEVQKVRRFRIIVEGTDLSEPFELALPVETQKTLLADIPEGQTRILTVEALNLYGEVVRRRRLEGITIDKEIREPIVVSLLTVPLFTNLRDGNVVVVSRLEILGVGEPGGRVEIEDQHQGTAEMLVDQSTGQLRLSTSQDLGQFGLVPPSLGLGLHLFRVRDVETGEQSEKLVRLIPAGSMPGSALTAVGHVDHSHVSSGGTPYGGMNATSANFVDVLLRVIP